MDLAGARVLVAGATGVIGQGVADVLTARGARLAVAGRDAARLERVARRLTAAGPGGAVPHRTFDAYDLDACAGLAPWAAGELGGLDAVVATVGTAAFGRSDEVTDAVAEHLATVNALAPIALFRAALPLLAEGGAVLTVTGVVAETPQPGMADYSASKSALAAWLHAVRREQRRRGVRVVEARLGHLDTGFAGRAVAGTPPRMPPAGRLDLAVGAIADALAGDTELIRPGEDGDPVLDRRAR